MGNQGVKIEWPGSNGLEFFKKRFDGAYIYEETSISARAVKSILFRQFEFMSRNLYFITFFSRFILGPKREEDIVNAEDAVLAFIRKAIKSLDAKVGQLQHLMQDNQISDNQMHSKKEAIQVPITTHGAKLYLHLLNQADKYYSLNNHLWLVGELDTKTKFENERSVRREVNRVVQQVANRFGEMLKLVRNKDKTTADLAGNHDEDKLVAQALADDAVDAPLASDLAASKGADAGTGTKKTRKKSTETAAEAAA